MNLILPLIAVGAVALLGKRKIDRVGNIRYQFKDLVNLKIQPLTTKLDARIDLINPESFPIRVNSVFTDVIMNGKKVALVNANFNQLIKPRETSTINLPITIQNVGGLQSLITQLTSGSVRSISLDFVGFIDTEIGRVNFVETKRFEL